MMPDVLQECAQNFDSVTNYNYLLTVGKGKNYLININLKCLEEHFTHITGLDHLTDIREFATHNTQNKISAFQNILLGNISYSDVSASAFFNEPFINTYNTLTQSEYKLSERISALKNIGDLLDKAYTGKLYKWNMNKSIVKHPNGRVRRTQIPADYMLAIPSLHNQREKIYLFMYKDKHSVSNSQEIVHLNVFSAFPECLDLSQGQERPFTILEEEKINVNTNERTIIYRSSSYKKQINDIASVVTNIEKWADDVQDIQQSRKNNIHR